METTLTLAALGALVIAITFVAVTVARSRRPHLRLPMEDDLEADGEEALMRGLEPPKKSPIDRDARVLDLEPLAERKRLPPRGGA